MPIWAFQKRIIGNPTPEKAAFVSSFADCDELFVINQRFLNTQDILNVLNKGEVWRISRCFTVSKMHLRKKDSDENELHFYVGTIQGEYTHIDRDILGIEHDFFFSNSIKLDKRHFVAYRNISILARIDKVVDQDVYIGGSHSTGCIPIDAFEFLIQKFPKTAELDR